MGSILCSGNHWDIKEKWRRNGEGKCSYGKGFADCGEIMGGTKYVKGMG